LPHPFSPVRAAGPIDESSLVALSGNTHPLAQAKFDRGPAPVSMPADRLVLVLARSTEQEAGLQTYLESVQDANSPNYHKFLSPEEFGKSFGVGDSDLQAVQTWLTGHGFTVNKVAKGRMAIEFSGTAGQVQSAFHTSIHSYAINGEQYWANAADPQITTALASVVAGLASLNSFKPRAQYILGPSGAYDAKTHIITPTYTAGNTENGYYIFLVPADAATIYNTPTALNANLSGTAYNGAGVTIGIAGDSSIDLTQNANYRSTFGLATPTPLRL
jgi:subtilase family serine protease